MAYNGPPLPPPTVLTALAIGEPPDDCTRSIPPTDSPFNARTYTLDLFDDGLFKRSTNDASIDVIVQTNVDMPIPVNSHVHFVQGGAGAITFVAAPGVTFHSAGVTGTTDQWSVVHLWQFALNNWLLYVSGGGGGGGGGAGNPAPPDLSVQYNNAGVFGGSANWLFDAPNSGFTLGTDVQQYREDTFTLAYHTTTTSPLTARFYGYYDSTTPGANYDRLTIDYQTDPVGAFYMGLKMESDNDGRDTDGWVLLQPYGLGGITWSVPDMPSPYGNMRGMWAVDLQPGAAGSSTLAVAGGSVSAIVGGMENAIIAGTKDANCAGIFAGNNGWIQADVNPAIPNADCSVICGGDNDWITGDYNFCGAGHGNSLYGIGNAAIGGVSASIGGHGVYYSYAAAIGGSSNSVQADGAVALGGFFNAIIAKNAVVMGARGEARLQNSFVQGADRARRGAGDKLGQMQTVSHVLQGITQVDFPTLKLTLDGTTTLSAANALLIKNGSAYGFEARVACKHQGFPEGGFWIITGCIVYDNVVSPAGTAFVGTPVVTVVARSNPAWTVGVVANTTLGSLDIVVTGEPSTAVWWTAQVRTCEIWSAD